MLGIGQDAMGYIMKEMMPHLQSLVNVEGELLLLRAAVHLVQTVS